MPNIIPYFLTFPGGLHIGTRGTNLEEAGLVIPSDTLYAALTDIWNRSGGEAAEFLQPFVKEPPEPPFLLSSAFPFAGKLRFYPMPVDLGRILKPESLKAYGKQIKQVRFFSEGLLLKALAGEKLEPWLFPMDEYQAPQEGITLQGTAVWMLAEEIHLLPSGLQRAGEKRHAMRHLDIWKQHLVPRVTIDRVSSSSAIFHSGSLSFTPGCGLWFGVSWQNPEASLEHTGQSYPQALEAALTWLQDDGLGGDRTAGYGAFLYTKDEAVHLPDPTPDTPAYLLSRYHPRPVELPSALAHPDSAYRLETVGGWLRTFAGAAQRRKRIFLVAEGSLVHPPGFPAGDAVDVRPTYEDPEAAFPHPVYRVGLALATGWPGSVT